MDLLKLFSHINNLKSSEGSQLIALAAFFASGDPPGPKKLLVVLLYLFR